MRMMGLDVGRKRIGIAVCDESELVATPKQTLNRVGTRKDIAKLLSFAAAESVEKIIVGMPLSLDGSEGPQAEFVARFVAELQDATPLPVETIDERWTSVEAEDAMIAHGLKGRKRRKLVDKVAASFILQRYLDAQGKTSLPAAGPPDVTGSELP